MITLATKQMNVEYFTTRPRVYEACYCGLLTLVIVMRERVTGMSMPCLFISKIRNLKISFLFCQLSQRGFHMALFNAASTYDHVCRNIHFIAAQVATGPQYSDRNNTRWTLSRKVCNNLPYIMWL